MVGYLSTGRGALPTVFISSHEGLEILGKVWPGGIICKDSGTNLLSHIIPFDPEIR